MACDLSWVRSWVSWRSAIVMPVGCVCVWCVICDVCGVCGGVRMCVAAVLPSWVRQGGEAREREGGGGRQSISVGSCERCSEVEVVAECWFGMSGNDVAVFGCWQSFGIGKRARLLKADD